MIVILHWDLCLNDGVNVLILSLCSNTVKAITPLCKHKVVMSPFTKVEMSPLGDNRAFLTNTRRKCYEQEDLLHVNERNRAPPCH